jgi:hypothetical protein
MKVESVICWRWTPPAGYRSTFGPETVNTLRRMVARHYRHPHRFICVTDDQHGIDTGVEVLPDFGDFANLPSPHGGSNPSCYRRLRLFHPDAAQWFGERFVSLDLDTVVTGDLSPLWDRDEDFMMWGDTNPTTHYNGSMVLLKAGSRPRVWTEFDPRTSPQRAKSAGCWGSDQGWISYVLGPCERKWTFTDGVVSYRNHVVTGDGSLPAGARIVFFHGHIDPWTPKAQARPKHQWLREAYQ